jgi:FMN phosphatase YigB (HAD superfamily)
VGIAGNQTVPAGGLLRSMDLPSDMMATSDDWGCRSRRWFLRCGGEGTPCWPEETLYIGGRLDNDIRPAVAAAFKTALILRGPWATIQQNDPEADRLATMRIGSLAELPERIAAFNGEAH